MYALRTLTALLIVMIASDTLEATQHRASTDRRTSELGEVLLQDAWAHDVRIGRVAVESRVLVFRDGGEVSERIYDDTGVHDASGTWTLEQSDGSIVLVLKGDHLRDRGRFTIARAANNDAIELRSIEGERVLRFDRRKGLAIPRPSTP